MKYKIAILAFTALLSFGCHTQSPSVAPVAPVQPPDVVVETMNRLYNDSNNNCREPDTQQPRGHYYCSGIVIRGASDGDYLPWTHSPRAMELGGSSYSWIRHDVSMSRLANPAGFILRDITYGTAHNLQVQENGFICQYPFDANTKTRYHKGCGLNGSSVLYPQPVTHDRNMAYAWGQCEALDIKTLDEWVRYYLQNPNSAIVGRPQCSWNIESQRGWNNAIAAHAQFIADAEREAYPWNELILDTKGTDGRELDKYIAAFFYDPHHPNGENGLEQAQHFQAKLLAHRYNVPILRLDFTAPPAQRFSYHLEDQVVLQAL